MKLFIPMIRYGVVSHYVMSWSKIKLKTKKATEKFRCVCLHQEGRYIRWLISSDQGHVP